MSSRHEIDQLSRRLDRLEHEMATARRDLAALTELVEAESAEAGSPSASAAPASGRTEEEALRMEATPPPLPPPPFPGAAPAPQPAPSLAKRIHPFVTEGAGRASEASDSARVLREWLRRLQLLPPAGDAEGAEARLGAWWATRVGALLAVAGVVFFAVYVSLRTPPWVKFLELLAAAAGVTAAGRVFARKLPAFGEVVFAGGLSLGYFAAYAGHALPAVRVFPELWMSVVAQSLAVLTIVGAALWRRSAAVATLATALGLTTALVSGWGGLEGYALGAAAALVAMSVALRRGLGWEGPSVAALPGAYLVFGLGLWSARGGDAPSFAAWAYLVGTALLFFIRDWRSASVTAAEVTAEEKWFQTTNAGLALGCGAVFAVGWHRDELAVFYVGAAIVMSLGAWVRSLQAGRDDAVAAVFLAKAAGATALACIEVAGARNAAIALLVQAWVLAWTARRLGSRVLAAACWVAAALATLFFFASGAEAAAVVSWPAARTTLFAVGLTLLASEAGRWLISDPAARRRVEACAAFLAALGLTLATARWAPAEWAPVYAAALAGVLAGAAVWRGGEAAKWSATALGVVAQVWLWRQAWGDVAPRALGWNALVVIGAAVWAGARARSSRAAFLAWLAAAAGAVFTVFALLPAGSALAVAAALALATSWLTTRVTDRHLVWLATFCAAAGTACWIGRDMAGSPAWSLAAAALLAWALPVWLRANRSADTIRREEPLAETAERVQVLCATLVSVRFLAEALNGVGFWAGLAGLAVAAFGLALRPGVRPALAVSLFCWVVLGIGALLAQGGDAAAWSALALLAWGPALVWPRVPAAWKAEMTGWRERADVVQVALAAGVGLAVAASVFAGSGEVWAHVGLLALTLLAARPGRVEAAPVVAALVGAVLAGRALMLTPMIRHGETQGAGFFAVLAAGAMLAAAGYWLGRARGWSGRLAGGGALLVWFALFAAQRGGLAPYATVGWGLAAVALFMTGLFLRAAVYRRLGLLGLGLCIPRVLWVDLDSTLHRVIAFIALGLVLLCVGFSYHRFKHLVVDESKTPPDSNP